MKRVRDEGRKEGRLCSRERKEMTIKIYQEVRKKNRPGKNLKVCKQAKEKIK